MSVLTFVFIFVLVWWIVIFTVLPFGNAAPEKPEIGHAASAPANPRMKQKFILTSLIALAITTIMALVIHFTGFSLHNWVKAWSDNNS
jgi:predicted secreted protein